MKKLLSAVLAVAFLSSTAFAAEEAAPAKGTATKDDKAAVNERLKQERHDKWVEETHTSPAKKKGKKSAKSTAKKSEDSGASGSKSMK